MFNLELKKPFPDSRIGKGENKGLSERKLDQEKRGKGRNTT